MRYVRLDCPKTKYLSSYKFLCKLYYNVVLLSLVGLSRKAFCTTLTMSEWTPGIPPQGAFFFFLSQALIYPGLILTSLDSQRWPLIPVILPPPPQVLGIQVYATTPRKVLTFLPIDVSNGQVTFIPWCSCISWMHLPWSLYGLSLGAQ